MTVVLQVFSRMKQFGRLRAADNPGFEFGQGDIQAETMKVRAMSSFVMRPPKWSKMH